MTNRDDNHDDHDDTHEAREESEGHEGDKTEQLVLNQIRVTSPLSAHAERAMHETIGCAIRVHRALGPGFLESIYKKAMYLELDIAGLSYESERSVAVRYRNFELFGQRVDLIIENAIVVELKSVARLDDIHRSQLISYLRTTQLRGGLLINFRVNLLRDGIKRVVL